MKIHPMILPVVLACLLATIHLLPVAGEMADSAVNMDLPSDAGGWTFRPTPASEEELNLLADDTRFSKAFCLRPREGEIDPASGMRVPDRIDLSVVLSGHDMNNSIHRPERCMVAQGHLIGSSSNVGIELPNGRKFMTKRLLSIHTVPTNAARTEFVRYNCITYYFFIGHDLITQDHLERTLVDMKDRLLYGVDQHWAYVSVSMWYGKIPWIDKEITVDEADTKLRKFLAGFGETQIDWNMIRK